MSERKFTPGPWDLVYRNNNDAMRTFYSVLVGETVVDIATANERADARLIASAPGLLAALESLELSCTVDLLNPCWDNRIGDIPGKHWSGGEACPRCSARAAIAKALGTTER